jgi:arsenite methyltransferase
MRRVCVDGKSNRQLFLSPYSRREVRILASSRKVFRLNLYMNSTNHDPERLREEVRHRYGSIANGEATLGGANQPGDHCCQPSNDGLCSNGCRTAEQARTLGYSDGDFAGVPEGANLGLGCGNPVALASLRPGETVLDLGAGAGFDAFIASRTVGPEGRVIGVDMTPEMISKARTNAKKSGYANVEFRLGEIEALPVADASVDIVISNCVINLCPDKRSVYREAFRVLRSGGRLAVSDVVAREPLSDDEKGDLALYSGCLSGAILHADLIRILEETGFIDIAVRAKGNTDEIITSWETKRGFESKVFAAEVTAKKPSAACCGSTCCS